MRAAGADEHARDLGVTKLPGERHLGKRLTALGRQIVQRHDLAVHLGRKRALLEVARVVAHARIGRHAVEVAVGEQALRERREGDDAAPELGRGSLGTVVGDAAVKDVVAVLVEHVGHVALVQDLGGGPKRRLVIAREAHVERLALLNRARQRTHRLLERGLGVHAVVVEDVHVVEPHALEALVERGQQVLAAAVVPVGSGPHVVASLGGDEQFVTIGAQVVTQELAHVALRLAIVRAVVVGQVEVRDAVVEGRKGDAGHLLVGRDVAEVVPHAQAHGRQLQARGAATPVVHGLVAGLVGHVGLAKIRHALPHIRPLCAKGRGRAAGAGPRT